MNNNLKIDYITALKDNYIWIICDPDRKQALAIDPGEATNVQAYLERAGLNLTGILLTHHHWDHTNGVAGLKEWSGCQVYGAADNALVDVPIDQHFKPKDFAIEFDILRIPGHTLDHLAFYTGEWLFCGDTLFAAGCGRVFEGTMEQMYVALEKLASLPSTTRVYCAHEYTLNNLKFAQTVEPDNQAIQAKINKVTQLRAHHLPSLPSTIAEELATNPFLRCREPSVVASAEHHAQQQLTTSLAVFQTLRQWKDKW